MAFYVTIVTIDTLHPLINALTELHSTIYRVEIGFLLFFLGEIVAQIYLFQAHESRNRKRGTRAMAVPEKPLPVDFGGAGTSNADNRKRSVVASRQRTYWLRNRATIKDEGSLEEGAPGATDLDEKMLSRRERDARSSAESNDDERRGGWFSEEVFYYLDLCGTLSAIVLSVGIHQLQRLDDGTTAESRALASFVTKFSAAARVLRLLRLLRIFAPAARRVRTSESMQYFQGRIPAREFAQGIALIFVCIGFVLVTSGVVTYFERKRTSFLRADLPEFAGSGVAFTGVATMVVAIVSWALAYLSIGKEMTLGVLAFSCIAMALVTLFVDVNNAEHWAAAIEELGFEMLDQMHDGLDSAAERAAGRAADFGQSLWNANWARSLVDAVVGVGESVARYLDVSGASFEDGLGESSACPVRPPPDQYVLFCSASYLSDNHYLSPWHAEGHEAIFPDRYDVLATTWCLDETISETQARLASPAYADCLASEWWLPTEPPRAPSIELDEVLDETPELAAADPEGVFAALGQGDLPANAKTLFCLCEGASKYRGLMAWYSGSLAVMHIVLALLAILPCSLCCCICLCPCLDTCVYLICPQANLRVPSGLLDRSTYYDPDLL